MAEQGFTLGELARRSGVPADTLRSWIRKGVLPRAHGKSRAARYNERHLLRAGVVKKLRQARLALPAIRAQLARLSESELRGLLPSQAKVAAAGVAKGGAEVALPALPEAKYPNTKWELIELTRGLVLMVHGDSAPGLRRVAEHIYQHYGERKQAGETGYPGEVVGRASVRP